MGNKKLGITRNAGARLFLLVLLVISGLVVSGCGEPNVRMDRSVTHTETNLNSPAFIPASYLIGAGDQLEVLYHIDPTFSAETYKIDTEDVLRVEFYYYPEMTTTLRVRPDGMVTLPKVGDVMAVGSTPMAFAKKLSDTYRAHLKRPVITVDVTTFNAKVEELKKAITTTDRGQSRLVVVRPDGYISLPYVGDVVAVGKTPTELSSTLVEQYRHFVNSVNVSVTVLDAKSNMVYIMGQVTNPNFYQLIGPTTLSQLVAMAAGLTSEANVHDVVLISRDPNGHPTGQLVDLDEIIGQGNIGADIMLKQYDVVFVPRTGIAKAALVADYIWRLIPAQFTGSATYSLGGVSPE